MNLRNWQASCLISGQLVCSWFRCMEKEDMGAHVMLPSQSLSLELSNWEIVGAMTRTSQLCKGLKMLKQKRLAMDK
ncbi:hypothetical protein U9M48_033911 [Paspalum notatum var. saurae]|uniref:Uncharacterized protein n=1 Tax=Paspalum notatum var. saurae TaxID=547442 RepID=A0AAQ3U8I7_PASNO